jgi:hypothetical protein
MLSFEAASCDRGSPNGKRHQRRTSFRSNKGKQRKETDH